MYKIIRDTREKTGWEFSPYEDCQGTVEAALKTGDYTIEGTTNLLCIERKSSPEELCSNLVMEKDRFHRELERMRPFKYKYIICEFSLKRLLDFPNGSKLNGKTKITGKYLYRLITEIQLEYGVHILYAEDSHTAYRAAGGIIKRVYEKDLK